MEIRKTDNSYQLGRLKAQGLAPRENQTLLLMANGYSYKAAAKELGCGEKTIAGRMQNIFYKLKATNTAHAICLAFTTGKLTQVTTQCAQ